MTFLGRGFSYPRVGLAMSLRHLVPVALSLCLGAALFLYWRESSQLQDSRLALRQLKRELTSSRGERDQVQFKLNLLREDVESTQRELEESERHLQELDEQLQEEQGKLRESRQELSVSQAQVEVAQNVAKECKDASATLEEVIDQLKTQLSECEADGKDSKGVNERLYHEQEVLKEEIIRRKREIEKLSQQLTDVDVQKLTCSQDLGDCNLQLQRLKKAQADFQQSLPPPPMPDSRAENKDHQPHF